MTEPRQCPVCETTPAACTCPPDEGGEKPCLHCGTTGWDCLDGLNRPDGQHCCGTCPMISGHKRPSPHVPIQLGTHDRDGYRTHAIPGDACHGCSDPLTGRWVPISDCPEALAALDRDEHELTAGEDPAAAQLVRDLRRRDEAHDTAAGAPRPHTLQQIRERVARMTPEESRAALAYARRVELQMLSDRFMTIRWTTRRYRPLRARHEGSG